MIAILGSKKNKINLDILEIIYFALLRSLGNLKIKKIFNFSEFLEEKNKITLLVILNTNIKNISEILKFCGSNRIKIIIFGRLSHSLFSLLDVQIKKIKKKKFINKEKSKIKKFSDYSIIYNNNSIINFKNKKRYFEKYDFSDEWNNSGYGKIINDDYSRGISDYYKLNKKNIIADVCFKNTKQFAYAGLWNTKKLCLLWFNRPVGPVDSFEWRVVELFLSKINFKYFSCFPLISDIPSGLNAVATSRLDCDEEIHTANKLVNRYLKLKIPISLAITTRILNKNSKNKDLLKKVKEFGGSILSHSVDHPNNWGENYNVAHGQAKYSKIQIKKFTGIKINYAVSPFHQNPKYAVRALSDNKYKGLITGIIKNDPEMIFGRPGRFLKNSKMVSLSQQCMLHGDICNKKSSLQDYLSTAKLNLQCKMIFGFLDHPFSERYQYGWKSETQRSMYHSNLVKKLKRLGFTFLSLDKIMDHIYDKSKIIIRIKNKKYKLVNFSKNNYKIEFKSKNYILKPNKTLEFSL